MISFKGAQFPREVILFAVFFYVRYTVSYRDLEEILAERGVQVDHATLEGIEVANMIRKGQMTPGLCPFAQFAALAA